MLWEEYFPDCIPHLNESNSENKCAKAIAKAQCKWAFPQPFTIFCFCLPKTSIHGISIPNLITFLFVIYVSFLPKRLNNQQQQPQQRKKKRLTMMIDSEKMCQNTNRFWSWAKLENAFVGIDMIWLLESPLLCCTGKKLERWWASLGRGGKRKQIYTIVPGLFITLFFKFFTACAVCAHKYWSCDRPMNALTGRDVNWL